MTRLSKAELEKIDAVVDRYRIVTGKGFSLADHDPADTGPYDSDAKSDAREMLAAGIDWLADHQAMLAAQDSWAVLLIFQARDAAGKDSTIKHVMSGINPQGCDVVSFKHPSATDLDHDYLWRYLSKTPARGKIGIFNRSYYEEVLIVRVHEHILAEQKMPARLVGDDIWQQRFEDIRNFENYLSRNGVSIIKFFLNVSRDEQKRRFMDRLTEPEKHWKFSRSDIEERAYWDEYTRAYEDAIRNTASEAAPWYVVPADVKWFTRLIVAAAVARRFTALDLSFPKLPADKLAELDAARKWLEREDAPGR